MSSSPRSLSLPSAPADGGVSDGTAPAKGKRLNIARRNHNLEVKKEDPQNSSIQKKDAKKNALKMAQTLAKKRMRVLQSV